MKPYQLLILSLALFQVAFSQSVADESWTLLTPQQVDNSQRIQSALRAGGYYIIRQGVLNGNISDATYDVTGIYTVHLLDAPGVTYKFELQVINDAGEIWRLKYDVAVNQRTGEQTFPRFRYGTEDDERWDRDAEFGGYQSLPQDIYEPDWFLLAPEVVDNNDTLQTALKFGGNYIIRQGVGAGDIANTSYDVTGIYGVYLMNAPNTTYKFELQVINDDGEIWRLKYDVHFADGTGALSVPRFRYGTEDDVRWDQDAEFGGYQSLPENIYNPFGDAEEEEEEVVVVEEEVVEEEVVIVEEEEEVPIVQEEEEVVEEELVIPEEEAPFVEIWEPVEPAMFDQNETLHTAIVFGTNATIGVALELGELPNLDYDMTGIYSVKTQVNAPVDRDNYRFDVQVTNVLDQLLRVKCDVAINETTGRMRIYRWAYGRLDAPVWKGELLTEFGGYDYLPEEEVFVAQDENNVLVADDEAPSLLL